MTRGFVTVVTRADFPRNSSTRCLWNFQRSLRTVSREARVACCFNKYPVSLFMINIKLSSMRFLPNARESDSIYRNDNHLKVPSLKRHGQAVITWKDVISEIVGCIIKQ